MNFDLHSVKVDIYGLDWVYNLTITLDVILIIELIIVDVRARYDPSI